MAATNRKKRYYDVTQMSSGSIYALLDAVDSDNEEDIENLMNDSDTEFNADDTDTPSKKTKKK